MCLYPKLIKNPKYKSNKKNGGIIPAVIDNRVLYVPIGCGECMECKRQKSRNWQVRLTEDIKTNTNGKFITLTFSNESIHQLIKTRKELKNIKGYKLDNSIATIAVKLFRERWRKQHKKSPRHWLVTELGHHGTENLHLHGIIYTKESYREIEKLWQYGFIWPTKYTTTNTYINEATINYLVKYIHKQDKDHPKYKPIVLTSPGIGANYLQRYDAIKNTFKEADTNELYKTKAGLELPLPIYYRNKLYSDEQKEKLWIHKLNKNERYVCGEKCKADDTTEYYRLLEFHRMKNTILGFGTGEKEWIKEEYENNRRDLMYARRTPVNENGYPKEWDE